MFFPGSRYASMQVYPVRRGDGSIVQAVKLPAPGVQAVIGYYRRSSGNRLDQIAGRFMGDATRFWDLCDANGAVVPDALAARDLIGIPLDATPGG